MNLPDEHHYHYFNWTSELWVNYFGHNNHVVKIKYIASPSAPLHSAAHPLIRLSLYAVWCTLFLPNRIMHIFLSLLTYTHYYVMWLNVLLCTVYSRMNSVKIWMNNVTVLHCELPCDFSCSVLVTPISEENWLRAQTGYLSVTHWVNMTFPEDIFWRVNML